MEIVRCNPDFVLQFSLYSGRNDGDWSGHSFIINWLFPRPLYNDNCLPAGNKHGGLFQKIPVRIDFKTYCDLIPLCSGSIPVATPIPAAVEHPACWVHKWTALKKYAPETPVALKRLFCKRKKTDVRGIHC